MTDAEFLQVFNRLCVALRETQDETGITQGVYFDALRDLSLEALQAGADGLAKQGGRKFFPTTAEWRQEAERAAVAALRKALPSARYEPWHHDCNACEDTGWVLGLECDGSDRCGRRKIHAPHSYTEPCPCRATNRTYQRHQQVGYAS